MKTWQLQEAKNRLSHVLDEAELHGPQVITRHGEEVAVVMAIPAFRKLVTSRQKLSEFFAESPLVGADIDLRRDSDPGRKPLHL